MHARAFGRPPIPTTQVSSLLSATYMVPWPPFFSILLDAFGSINIDIAWFRQPFNALMRWISEAAVNWSCNLGDMSARELFMYQ